MDVNRGFLGGYVVVTRDSHDPWAIGLVGQLIALVPSEIRAVPFPYLVTVPARLAQDRGIVEQCGRFSDHTWTWPGAVWPVHAVWFGGVRPATAEEAAQAQLVADQAGWL